MFEVALDQDERSSERDERSFDRLERDFARVERALARFERSQIGLKPVLKHREKSDRQRPRCH